MKDFMEDIVHFLVYRWPYLCHMSPEGLSTGQTPGAGITEAGLAQIWVLGNGGAEHTPQVLGALPRALSSLTHQVLTPPQGVFTPVDVAPPGPSLGTLCPAGLSTLGWGGW